MARWRWPATPGWLSCSGGSLPCTRHSWLRVHNTHEWPDHYAHEQDLLAFFDHVIKKAGTGWDELANATRYGPKFNESGWKASGAGRLHGLRGIDDFLEHKLACEGRKGT